MEINNKPSNSILKNQIKERLEDVCNVILYSSDIAEVTKAYDIFFTQYRQMIIGARDPANLSCVEDVIYKILYDEIGNKLEQFGLKYSPFARFVAMVRDQEHLKKYKPNLASYILNKKNEVNIHPLTNLKNYIFIVAQTEEDFEKKNQYIKNILHQCYVKEI